MSRTQNTQFPQQFRTFTKSLSEHPLTGSNSTLLKYFLLFRSITV